MKKILLTVLLCMAAVGVYAAEPFTVHIKGTVIDRPEKTAVLFRTREHSRNSIPLTVEAGKIQYDLTTDTREMWSLFLEDEDGSLTGVDFFAEPGDVILTINSDEKWAENTLQGGALNTEYSKYGDFAKLLDANFDRAETDLIERGFKEIYWEYVDDPDTGKSIRIEHNDNLATPEGRALDEEFDAIYKQHGDQHRDYLRRHPGEVSYAVIYRYMKRAINDGEDTAPWLTLLTDGKYFERFPENPYRKLVADLLRSEEQLKVGGHYIDFTLPDLDGNMVTVSEVVNGKVALIDLWMTWCGPCRGGLMEAIPVWNEFRDRGFVVVTASGDNSLIAIRNAARHDGHPWPTLVDLGGAAGLYARYGLSNAGGSSYLIDRDGTILAINPSAEKLRTILTEKLGGEEVH